MSKIMKLLSWAMIAVPMTAGLSEGATYYLDPAGYDSNNGLSESAPWKTIARVSRAAFSPGDSILLKRGGVWREQLNIPSSGSSGNPITFGAYGMGDKPVINGAAAVNGWTRYNGSIYVADIGSLNIAAIKQLFVDGNYYDLAHYPNSGYLHVDANSTANDYLIDGDLSRTQEEVVGSTVVIRLRHWQVNQRLVATYDPGTHRIGWSEPYSYSPPPWAGYGYYLQGKLWMLDTAQEWYYDGAAKRLYLWLENGDDPSAHAVEVSSNSHGIYANNRSFININDITVKNANENGVYLLNAINAQAGNVEIYNSGTNGFFVGRSTNISIFNCKISSSISAGIEIRLSNYSNVANSEIADTGTVGKLKNSYAGIYQQSGDHSTFRNNKIFNSGYAGISWFRGTNHTIQNNFIKLTCMRLTDCGAIYTWGLDSTYAQIIGNIIVDSLGSADGSAPVEASAKGIYLDDGNSYKTVADNTTINTSQGIQLKGHHQTISHNTVFNAREEPIYFTSMLGEVPVSHELPHDNIVTNNNFFNTHTATAPVGLYSNFGDTANDAYGVDLTQPQYASFDYNNYFQPYSEIFAILLRNGYRRLSYNFSDWQSVKSQDRHSVDVNRFYEIRPYKATSYLGVNLVANGNFDSDINGWGRSPIATTSMTWVSSTGLDGGAVKFLIHDSTAAALRSNLFAIQSGRTYEIKFSVMSDQVRDIDVTVADAATTAATKRFKIDASRREIGLTFIPAAALSGARLSIRSSARESWYYLDNVSLREVNADYNDPSDDMSIIYNAGNVPKTISLQGQRYCDVSNNIVEGSVTLEPYSSKILLSCFNNKDGFCNNRETYASAPGEGCPLSMPDTTAPVVSISTPTHASQVSGTRGIAGTASDNVAVSSVAVSIDGAAYRLASGTASWTFSLNTAALSNSSHTITARAVDTSGNASWAAITVTVNNPDATVPTIAITSPTTASTYTTTSATIGLSGTASDNVGVASVTWSNAATGASGAAAGAASWSIAGVPVVSGNNLITVTATDRAGNTASDTITITYAAPDVGFSCTQVIGFSQAIGWFQAGFEQAPGIDNSQWQYLGHPGASIEMWTDPNYNGWLNTGDRLNYVDSPTIDNDHIYSNCATNALNPDRVIVSITSTPNPLNAPSTSIAYQNKNEKISADDLNDWIIDIKTVISVIKSKYSNARQIVLQPVIGGSNHSLCASPADTPSDLLTRYPNVRASVNHPIIDQAIDSVVAELGSQGVVIGFSPLVRGCSDYADYMGHLTNPGYAAAAVAIGNYYGSLSSDATPPSIPRNLTATAVSSSRIDLSWSASTDNVGVAGYNVYRGTIKISSVTAGTTYSNTGLPANTSYSYTISAYDAAGNTSAPSSSAGATTLPALDTAAPSGTISINNGAASINSVNAALNLTAGDNIGVTGYYVSESPTAPNSQTVWVAVTSAVNYSANNVPFTLSSGNGAKTVYAWYKDAAGNVSAMANDGITLTTTIAQDDGWKNFMGYSGAQGISGANDAARYAKQMGYDYIMVKDDDGDDRYGFVSNYKTNTLYSGLKHYVDNPYFSRNIYQDISRWYSRNNNSLIDGPFNPRIFDRNYVATIPQSNKDFYEGYMVWKNNDPFPDNIDTGYRSSVKDVSVMWDFQQQRVIDYVVARSTELFALFETPNFQFAGYMEDASSLYGDFTYWDPSWVNPSTGVRTGREIYTSLYYLLNSTNPTTEAQQRDASSVMHSGITHEYSSNFEGHAAFIKALGSAMKARWPNSKRIGNPWHLYAQLPLSNPDETLYQIKNRADRSELMPDLLLQENSSTEFADNAASFAVPGFTKDMAGISQNREVGEKENRTYAGKAGINGMWFNWFQQIGGQGNVPAFSSLANVYPRLKLIRVISNWDNLNKIAIDLAQRVLSNPADPIYDSYDAKGYQQSHIDKDVMYSRHWKTGKLFAVFTTNTGVGKIKLKPGETVASAYAVDNYFMENSTQGDRKSIDFKITPFSSGDEIALNSSVTIDVDSAGINGLGIGQVKGNGYIFTLSVSGALPDAVPPAVSISAPTNASKVSGITAITGAASDNVAVSSVAVSIDGAAYRLASGTASWTFSLNTAALSNSSHTITARAVDAAGNASSAAITVTVNNPDTTLPVITSVPNATGTIGTSLSYQITAANTPTSFSAAGLPAGLSVSTATGLISGTPATVGISSVTISAANANGTGSAGLALSVYSACDLNRDWASNVADVQLQVNQALGVAACASDLNRDGSCNVADVQRDVNAGLGGPCVLGP